MACAEAPRLQAYFDGEVDALTAVALEQHLESCSECRGHLAILERTRASLRRHLPLEQAPASLRERISQALDREAPTQTQSTPRARPWRSPPFWLGAGAGAGIGALAAALLAFFSATPHLAEVLEAAHQRSLMPAHLLDVASSERHTVKPWFAGHTDVSPVVGDFPEAGYQLLGARADYLMHQRAAVLVYRHGAHLINVFSWVAGGERLPHETTRAGYHMVCWRQGDLAYCAVSDTAWEELRGLERLLRDLPGPARE